MYSTVTSITSSPAAAVMLEKSKEKLPSVGSKSLPASGVAPTTVTEVPEVTINPVGSTSDIFAFVTV